MKSALRFVRTTLAVGVLFLAPIVVITIILDKAFAISQKIVQPVAERLPAAEVVGLRPAKLLAIALIMLFCFLTGVFARTTPARKIEDWLEGSVLANLPGYQFFKGIGESMLGVEGTAHQEVVLVHLDAWQIGFLIEHLDNGLVAVFVPDAPNPRSGSVCFLWPADIRRLDVPANVAMKCMKRLGAGANSLLRGVRIAYDSPRRSVG
jgi:uncharacterized membrane protein